MMNKPFQNSFLTYGSIYHKSISPAEKNLVCTRHLASQKNVTSLLHFPGEVHIELVHGLASILIGASPSLKELSLFPIHSHLSIKPNLYFNIIPISNEVTYNLIASKACIPTAELSVPYTYFPISAPFQVGEILDCYQTDVSQFHIHTSSHNYFELIYVSEGNLNLSIEKQDFALSPHELILCAPNNPLYPRQITIDQACSYLTIVFNFKGKPIPNFVHHIFRCSSDIKDILWKLTKQLQTDSFYIPMLTPCYLQEVLIHLYAQASETKKRHIVSGTQSEVHRDLFQQVLTYMNTHITEPITIEEICREFFISRSSLQTLFKMYLQISPKSYLLSSKLEKSKELIRENQHTVSEIAYLLGFSSIHYFSRLFKKYFDMSPSEYAKQAANKTPSNTTDDRLPPADNQEAD